jgi:hypothetical protein
MTAESLEHERDDEPIHRNHHLNDFETGNGFDYTNYRNYPAPKDDEIEYLDSISHRVARAA